MSEIDRGKLRNMAKTAMMTALICLLTTTLHIPAGHGYVHMGDAMIYLAAALLPMPYAICAAAIGGGMADLFSGYAMYIFPTMCIKSLLAFTCSLIGGNRLFCPRRMLACVICCIITVMGYWFTEVLLYQGDPCSQFMITLPANLIQSFASAILFAVCAATLDRIPSPLTSKRG